MELILVSNTVLSQRDRAPRGGADAEDGAMELQLGLGYPLDHHIHPAGRQTESDGRGQNCNKYQEEKDDCRRDQLIWS